MRGDSVMMVRSVTSALLEKQRPRLRDRGTLRPHGVLAGPSAPAAQSRHQHVSGNHGPDDDPASCAAVHSGVPSISDEDLVCTPPEGIASLTDVREVAAPPQLHAVTTSSARATSFQGCHRVSMCASIWLTPFGSDARRAPALGHREKPARRYLSLHARCGLSAGMRIWPCRL